ncbi:MAG: putative oxidoreductase [Phormidesmis priestleyi Ana]|uniref:Putative oxidoreductase n=1 Tax=Phormidesmis priestleyi Ana TaxID=1666911 RepID=A0A0P8BUE8_9CYAN|nr:MAG: putative oxidoreductase [Phormidesmis priestleyi Ana]
MTYLPLAARICLALIFLNAGVNHLLGFSGFVSTIASKGLPLPQVLAIGAIAFLLLGAVSLILGYKSQIGALLLILFLIPTTLIFHPFLSDLSGFLKNLALIGGLLMVMAYGPGLISLDGSKS